MAIIRAQDGAQNEAGFRARKATDAKLKSVEGEQGIAFTAKDGSAAGAVGAAFSRSPDHLAGASARCVSKTEGVARRGRMNGQAELKARGKLGGTSLERAGLYHGKDGDAPTRDGTFGAQNKVVMAASSDLQVPLPLGPLETSPSVSRPQATIEFQGH